MPNKKPANLDALRERIAERSGALTPRLREAARHALEHPNDMALNPVARVAALSGIPAAAFIRMAQALGFTGYAELQRVFIEPLQRAAAPSFRERIRHCGGELIVDGAAWHGRPGMGRFVPRGEVRAF